MNNEVREIVHPVRGVLLRDTPYRHEFLPVPGIERGPSAVDIPVYLAEWFVGAVECKPRWSSAVAATTEGLRDPSKYNSGWKKLYTALGQVMLHGRAATLLGHRLDSRSSRSEAETYNILSRLWPNYPDLPLAIVMAAIPPRAEGGKPVLLGRPDVEASIRRYLKKLNVDLILCWQVDGETYLDGETEFLEHVGRYVEQVTAAVTAFEQGCSATVALLDRLNGDCDIVLRNEEARAATFAFGIASQCLDVGVPPNHEMWSIETLRASFEALADEDGMTMNEMLEDLRRAATRLRDYSRRALDKARDRHTANEHDTSALRATDRELR